MSCSGCARRRKLLIAKAKMAKDKAIPLAEKLRKRLPNAK